MKKNNIRRYGIITLILILIIIFGSISCRIARIKKIEANLGITIPAWTSVSGNTNFLGQDYIKQRTLKFTNKGLSKLIKQIEQTKYYDLHHDFYGNNETEWKKSDTAFYDTVSEYLSKEHLTGYWIKTDSSTLVFHEPDFGDIPNSAILFDEAYNIEAELFIKDKKMVYRYIKY